jgi:hypothetical protein
VAAEDQMKIASTMLLGKNTLNDQSEECQEEAAMTILTCDLREADILRCAELTEEMSTLSIKLLLDSATMDLLQAINQEEYKTSILQDIIMMIQEDTMTIQAITVHQDNTMHLTFTEEADLTSEMKIQEDLPDTKTENSIQDR